ncbi:MAG: tripartite tricarboxylate transporter substrate binding protein [Betaproteobacteria bacterium]|nr:tripartite tricarboxylate transporter substrate binding protein [Betaproteobacteria bacterium]
MLRVVWLLIGAVYSIAAAGAAAQNYPVRPIRMIVPYVAGGSYDTIARVVAQPMSESWVQPVVIDNRPGATGIIGTETVARATADGYTIAMFGGNQTLTPAVRSKLPYDMLKDFAPITRVALLDNIVTIHPSVPAKSLREFIALLKANPGKYHYGSGGAAGDSHFASALFTLTAGVNVVHVPYKGGGLAVNGLVANEVQMMVVNIISAAPQIKAGRLRGLAIAARERSRLLPDLPTTTEAGLPGYEWGQWYAIFAPTGTPKTVLARLHSEIKRVVSLPEVKAKLANQGARSMLETPQELAAFVKQNIDTNRKIARDAKIRVE